MDESQPNPDTKAVEPATEDRQWLTLGQAARSLGVHPTTLRRWAEAGAVPMLVTPGGHRRFAVQDLDRFAERRVASPEGEVTRLWARHALEHVRDGLTDNRETPALERFDEPDRVRGRALGRRLMTVAMHYIAGDEHDAELLEEAAAIGRQQAEAALQHGLSLTQVTEMTLFFRDTLLEVALDLPEVTQRRPEASSRLVRRLNTLLNAVQLAISRTYEHQLER